MIDSDSVFLTKAEENLEAAQSEFAKRRFNTCASRSYYACFQAAIFALARNGIRPFGRVWNHSFVQAEFVRHLINREKAYPADLRTVMTENYALRIAADYAPQHVSQTRAERAVARADRFVAALRSTGGDTA